MSACVRIEQIGKSWVVIVEEDGEPIRHTFEREKWANSFADGQRSRLGIPQTKSPAEPIVH